MNMINSTNPVASKPAVNRLSLIQQYGMFFILILVAAIFTMLTPNFLTPSNLINILRQVSVIGIVAAGQTLVIITSGIDLSVGSIVGLSGAVSAGVTLATGNAFLGIAAGLLTGMVFGVANGLLISRLKLTPFIVTLASMTMLSGFTLIYTGGNPILVTNPVYKFIGQGYVGPIPFPVVVLLLVYAILYFVLKRTVHGQYIYAIGGNEKASLLAGVRVNLHKTIVYGTSGLLAGLASVILTARLSSATPVAGTGYELDAIAAVILGGTSLFGGKGSVVGTLIGVLLLGILTSGMNLINVSPFYQNVAKGLIVLLAVIIDRMINKEKQ
ncbi:MULTISPECIES: ribose ABC transporter permease [Brevibacillus]|jgi:ribose/xylose/arabinose/galactoside ABC-type transport system permease subunit|uniref:ABC transporter permease n=2 Tax=Brevibacillus TaxID=55080 RepID=UPI000469CE6E|nr:ribose ABC transporter permease [Brevibacillus borstelensis]MBE5394954.1 ribose ABC transporter permease [Brevibacillus borstelensis]MCC0563172.1 ribose ABC transporter permease [Brevibacillus borstelensis]MCM3472760.1 ribose ABC transporter permease [Brevibacillus borstelensis]MCM3557595.1 ribose ABC transporter permease [Brevibacillus borstelensis]MCM3589831.1 ribose ABC transporter permease [Brevibacillus borstelensis]